MSPWFLIPDPRIGASAGYPEDVFEVNPDPGTAPPPSGALRTRKNRSIWPCDFASVALSTFGSVPVPILKRIVRCSPFGTRLAEQKQPVRRRVAIKLLKPGMRTREAIARFEAESQALAMMDHPHIARVFDAGTTESGQPYFVMELVRGVNITAFCSRGSTSWNAASCTTRPKNISMASDYRLMNESCGWNGGHLSYWGGSDAVVVQRQQFCVTLLVTNHLQKHLAQTIRA